MNNGIFVKCVITWHVALLAIIFSLVNWLFKKKGAISGPVAPTKIEAKPLMPPTLINDLDFFSFLGPFRKRYQIIKIPIIGFKKSTLISLADLTSYSWINKKIIKAD